jgi:L,D-transpeptidase catalytic domain
MGKHHTTSGFRLRTAAAAGLVTLGVLAAAGTAQAAGADKVDDTPCTAVARACVDLDENEAWLIGPDGEVERGPVDISPGGKGKETPTGDFRVYWKHQDHWSREYDAPMPWSVFFAPGGIAFHEGSLESPSGGCVRLDADDAAAFFTSLQVGDVVQVR